VLKDADLNRFIISVLEGAKGDENGEHSHYARIGNVQIDGYARRRAAARVLPGAGGGSGTPTRRAAT
jgi:hypothetical protein